MMLTNKELKQKGRITVRKHYLLLLMLLAIAVLFGNEFGANDGILSLSSEMDQKGAKAVDGRICAEGLIAFGVLGMMGIYILAPALDTLFMKINAKILAPVTAVLMSLFLADAVYSQFVPNVGEGITDMGRNTDMGSGVGSTEAGPT